jgi:hypothetical protein
LKEEPRQPLRSQKQVAPVTRQLRLRGGAAEILSSLCLDRRPQNRLLLKQLEWGKQRMSSKWSQRGSRKQMRP